MAIGDEIINLEIKARILDVRSKRKLIEAIGGKVYSVQEETDTYFNTKKGTSLKIKEIGGKSSLLSYQFDPLKKISNFKTFENLNDPGSLKDILNDILGIKSVISKRKTVYRYKNININFTEIDGLGVFVELQIASKNNAKDMNSDKEAISDLSKILEIKQEDIETHGYGDIICKVNYKI